MHDRLYYIQESCCVYWSHSPDKQAYVCVHCSIILLSLLPGPAVALNVSVCACLSDCTFSSPQLIVFAVQYIQHVTEMYVRMEALVVSTSLSTCANVLQHTVEHSAKFVSRLP